MSRRGKTKKRGKGKTKTPSKDQMYECVKRTAKIHNMEIEEVERIISKKYKNYTPQKITHHNFRRYYCGYSNQLYDSKILRKYLEENGVRPGKDKTKEELCDAVEEIVERKWEPEESAVYSEYDTNKLLALPPEIVLHIILQMPARDVMHLCSTSKVMRQFCGDKVWKELVKRDFGEKFYKQSGEFKENIGRGMQKYKEMFESYHTFYFAKFRGKTARRCLGAVPGARTCPYANMMEAVFVIPGPNPNDYLVKPGSTGGYWVRTVDITGKKIVYAMVRFDKYHDKSRKDEFVLLSSTAISKEEAEQVRVHTINDKATVNELKKKLEEARKFYTIRWE